MKYRLISKIKETPVKISTKHKTKIKYLLKHYLIVEQPSIKKSKTARDL